MKKSIAQKEKGNSYTIIIIIISTVAICGIGFFIWKNFFSQSKTNASTTNQNNTTNIEVSYIDRTSEWKVYSNQNFGFKLKYPDSIIDVSSKVDLKSPLIAAFNSSKEENSSNSQPLIRIYQYPSTKTAEDFALSNTVGEIIEKKNFNIGANKAFRISSTSNNQETECIYISDGKQIITLCTPDQSNRKDSRSQSISVFDEIANTFKFTQK